MCPLMPFIIPVEVDGTTLWKMLECQKYLKVARASGLEGQFAASYASEALSNHDCDTAIATSQELKGETQQCTSDSLKATTNA